MDLLSTIQDSNMEHFYPAGWDLKKIDACCAHQPEEIFDRQDFWNRDFVPISCDNADTFAMMMGHEIALSIKEARDAGIQLAMILPVGPMGMYRWAVYFLKAWKVSCSHVHGFNMDEWSDKDGNTTDPNAEGSFQNAMLNAFYGPLGELTVPPNQRNFASKENLPQYEQKIADIKSKGGKLITIYGIGRVFHIAFWEPHLAADFKNVEEWKKQTHKFGVKLHPLTIEQNALHSFKSRTTLVPAYANSIGPALFLQSDKMIGGADGCYNRSMMWQGMSLWTALRYGPDMWVPASFVPTLPGKLFFIEDLAGPLTPECN
ncbi:MAG: hypothetical protein RR459_06875 [Christensenellaceae bacterium]